MLVNVDNLADGDCRRASFSETVVLPENYSGEKRVAVNVDGVITNDDGVFYFDGKVRAVLSLNCDLCLSPFSVDLLFDMHDVFSRSTDIVNEKEFWTFSDKTIDLEPAVLSGILLNMPMKAVCSNSCKGLCHVCGHNLNEGDCGCDTTYVNPKFEKLKALFDDKEV